MSLSWRDRYVAVLAPAGTSLVCRPRGWRAPARVVDRGVGRDPEAGQPPWSAALDTLSGQLARLRARGGDLAVVLASEFVRYRVVPWSDAIGSPDEFEAYLHICFEEVYGAEVSAWNVRASREPAGCPRLAAAVDHALIDGLRTVAEGAGLRLVSVQPYLMAAFNRLASSIRQDDFIVAVAEPGRGSLLLCREGRWTSVRSGAGMDSDGAIAALVARECELQGLDPGAPAIYVHAPGRPHYTAGQINGVVPRALAVPVPEPAAAADPLLTMAMAAA